MIQNKLDNLFICINDKQVVLDIDAAKLFGVGIDTVNKAINNNLERFPSDFLITLTDSEKQEVVTKCDHLQNLKYSRNSPHAFTEAGIFMLATLIDSNEARNVAFKIIENLLAELKKRLKISIFLWRKSCASRCFLVTL